MIRWVATFLSTSIVAAVVGFSGLAAFATQIAWVAFMFGIATAIVFVLFDRRSPIH